jgi:hypothetical protein
MNHILRSQGSAAAKHLYSTNTQVASTKHMSPTIIDSQPNKQTINMLLNKTLDLATSQAVALKQKFFNNLSVPNGPTESTSIKNIEPDKKKIKTVEIKQKNLVKVGGQTIEEQTRNHCVAIKRSSSMMVKIHNLELLNKHLYDYNEARDVAIYEENLIGQWSDPSVSAFLNNLNLISLFGYQGT